jgi:plastocyanin
MKNLVLIGAALCVALLPACGEEEEPGSSVSQTAELEAFDYYFEPTSLQVELGSEVTIEFTNNGSVLHSFSAPDLDVEVEAGNGEEATVTFTAPDQPGSFDFFCKYHADDMNGTISIGGGDAPLEEDPDETDDEDEDVEVDVDTEEDDDAGAGSDDNY